MTRIAFLCDLDQRDLPVVGVAVETAEDVRCFYSDDYIGLKRVHNRFLYAREGGRDSVVFPGDPAYFDVVVLGLSRLFHVDVHEVGPAKEVAS